MDCCIFNTKMQEHPQREVFKLIEQIGSTKACSIPDAGEQWKFLFRRGGIMLWVREPITPGHHVHFATVEERGESERLFCI